VEFGAQIGATAGISARWTGRSMSMWILLAEVLRQASGGGIEEHSLDLSSVHRHGAA
jgi:hypothetical protein